MLMGMANLWIYINSIIYAYGANIQWGFPKNLIQVGIKVQFTFPTRISFHISFNHEDFWTDFSSGLEISPGFLIHFRDESSVYVFK